MRLFSTLGIVMFSIIVFAQQEHKLDDVVVTSGRVPLQISNITRQVEVITKKQIELLPVTSVEEAVKYLSGIDLKQRGTNGVQSDLTIRGSTFEQSLVMINGIKIVDPQTGHHNLNLPVTKNDIERIEIVKGQASKSFGPNAYSGVINIITNTYPESKIRVNVEGGENGYYSGNISGKYSTGNWTNSLSFVNSHSDGYRFNTGYDKLTFNLSSSLSLSGGFINVMFGYDDKDFGANSFYTIRYPKQTEHTISKLLTLNGQFGSDVIQLTPKIYWRNHRDEFLLDKDNLAFYKNIHQSNTYGAELQTSVKSNLGNTSLGVEYAFDDLVSNNLGNHKRERKGLFLEHIFEPLNKLNVNIGGFIYKYSDTNWKIWPGIDMSYPFSRFVKVFGSVGKAFRVPTYTELFYSDPVTQGNPNLTFEESTEYEVGAEYKSDGINAGTTIFRREGKNVIDWIRTSNDEAWTVMNIAKVNTTGFEMNLDLFPKMFQQVGISNVSLSYTYLDSDRSTGDFDSRYVLNHLRHDVSLSIIHESFLGLHHGWFVRYKDRVNLEDQFTIDARISKTLSSFEAYLNATNIFNKSYEDIEGVPLPGRWIIGGVSFEVNY